MSNKTGELLPFTLTDVSVKLDNPSLLGFLISEEFMMKSSSCKDDMWSEEEEATFGETSMISFSVSSSRQSTLLN